MHVPLCAKDLSKDSTFEAIARNIQRDWLGSSLITINQARNILAQCLGYEDYKDAQQSSNKFTDSSTPALQEVWSHSMAVISSATLKDSPLWGCSYNHILRCVKAWPLPLLTFYREKFGDVDIEITIKRTEEIWLKNLSEQFSPGKYNKE